MNLDEIQAKWQEEPDEYLLKAVEKDIAEYSVEVQGIIIAEADRRNLHDLSIREEIQTRKVRRRKYNLKRAGVVLVGIFLYIFVRTIFAFIPLRPITKTTISFLLAFTVCKIVWPSKKEI